MSRLAVPAKPSFVELSSGLSLPFVASGAGEPVVFVHGSLCDYRYWQPQLAGLGAHFRCVSVSLAHYWPAAHAARGLPFSWSRHADDVVDFIERLGAGPVHLVGHSRGGCVAFHAALRAPHLLRTLTLADPGGPVALEGAPLPHAMSPETLQLRERAVQLIESGHVEAGLELFVDSVSQPGSWARSTHAFRAMAIDNAHTLAPQLRDPLPAYTRNDAARIGVPVLLIDGERSPAIFHRTAGALAHWLPDARRASVAGASHGMNLARPTAFNRYVEQFVRNAVPA